MKKKVYSFGFLSSCSTRDLAWECMYHNLQCSPYQLSFAYFAIAEWLSFSPTCSIKCCLYKDHLESKSQVELAPIVAAWTPAQPHLGCTCAEECNRSLIYLRKLVQSMFHFSFPESRSRFAQMFCRLGTRMRSSCDQIGSEWRHSQNKVFLVSFRGPEHEKKLEKRVSFVSDEVGKKFNTFSDILS